jgi:proton-dependent oligopeptide transporter, POT family
MSTEVAPPKLKMPVSTWFIVTTEACERFSFYGMTSILTLYLQNLFLNHQATITTAVQNEAEAFAKERVHLFNAGVYYLPLLGGFLADRYLGRYYTILGLSLFYCLGHGALALFEGQETGIYLGLALIALGAGGIKPCVSAFVADQFTSLDERGLAKVYGIFYWAVNLGAAFAFAIIPAVADNPHLGYRWAFGIPGIFMAIAAIVFWLGTPLYVKRPTQVQVDAEIPPEQRRADRKTLLRIVIVLAPITIFWALYYQLNTSWVQQGKGMVNAYLFGTAEDDFSYKIDAQRIQAASAVLILVLVPFMAFVGYPLLRKIGLPVTKISKIAMGMLVTAAAFGISGLLQTALDGGAKLSILWQLVPYVPLEIGEVMVSVTGLEFAYAYAPKRMKSVVMGVWFCITATGNFLVAFLTSVIGTSLLGKDGTVTIPDDHRHFHLTPAGQFYFYAIMLLCAAVVFVLIAKMLMHKYSADEVTAT